MTARPSVPLATAALCGDCSEIYDQRLGTDCPRCASNSSAPVQSNRAADEITRLKDEIARLIARLKDQLEMAKSQKGSV